MASTYSSALGLQLVNEGEQAGVWGNSTNINFGKLIEQAIAGATVLNISSFGSSYSLNDVDGTPDQSRSAILRFTGTISQTVSIVVPTKPKVYTVRNDTNGVVVLKTAAQVGGVQLGVNEATILYCDGTIVRNGILEITPAILPVSGGGTGVSTFTAGIVKSPGGTAPLITESTVNVTTIEVGGVLSVNRGGLGVNSITPGGAVVGKGTAPIQVATGTSVGDYLTFNGVTWTGSSSSLGGVTSFNGRTGAVTPQSGDYSSFYVLKNGSNATGTWSINISGSAASANTATTASSISNPSSNAFGSRTVSGSTPSSTVSGNIWYQT